MKFSVIIVTLNSSNSIKKTLESALLQKYGNFEIIIIDGASNDGTIDIIKDYEVKFPGKIQWISERDSGIYNAMNKGIKMANSEFISIIGAGDWLEENALEKALECIQRNPEADAVYGKTRIWKDDLGSSSLVQTLPDILPVQPMQHPSIFYKKSLHNKFGLYNEKYKIVSDYLFCLKAFYLGKACVVPFDDVATNFVMDGVSSKNNFKVIIENIKVRKECGLRSNISREIRLYLKSLIKNLYSCLPGNDKYDK